MSVTLHLWHAAMSGLADRGTAQTPLDTSRAQDMYAIWKSVFERTVAVESSSRDVRPQDSEASKQGESNSRNYERDELACSEALSDAVHSQSLPAHTASTQQGIGASARTLIGAHSNAAGTPAALAPRHDANIGPTQMPPIAAQSLQVRDTTRSVLSSTQPRSTSAIPSNGKTAAVSPPDSINVFVQGAAVAIAVRDPEISEQEALRCAFETARELTGRRASLQQLTLNGRTLYQQPAAPARESQPSVLVFAC